MNIIVGMYIYCVMNLPLEVNKRIAYQEVYALCKVDIVNKPQVPQDSPTFVYVDCTKSVAWITKGQKRQPIMTYWSRYEKGACYAEKYHWENSL